MNVLVIEDERLTAERLVSMIRKYDPSINVLAQLESVSGVISWFENNRAASVELIFMDIHLEDGDSFQIVSKLDLKTPIIFTTAYDGYMIKAFKVNSVDYLLKPIDYDELCAALNKFKSLRSPQIDIRKLIQELSQPTDQSFKERFMITVGTKIRSIKTDDIAYFYLEEKTVLLVATDGTTLPVDYSLDKLSQLLNPAHFFRTSRQCIVSLNSIQMVHSVGAGRLKLHLTPKSKQEITVSGDRVADFKTWLGKD